MINKLQEGLILHDIVEDCPAFWNFLKWCGYDKVEGQKVYGYLLIISEAQQTIQIDHGPNKAHNVFKLPNGYHDIFAQKEVADFLKLIGFQENELWIVKLVVFSEHGQPPIITCIYKFSYENERVKNAT